MCAALLLAGCSSSGTVGGSAHGSTAGLLGSTTGGSGGTSGGTGGTGSSDAGCAQAQTAIADAEQAQSEIGTNPQDVVTKVTTDMGQLRTAATMTQNQDAAQAMNKVADDMQSILSQAANGQNPDPSTALADAKTVLTICGGS
ncbi:hypothetical protein KGQ20_12630 [Catenulispora sp. NF23]|uniref:hypothetical protein n=1 Tax=Catenulispora pinistramenti TaxID=2705254 RepID=UPI001BAE35D7|nr:hypothetical protein [Catenulispora pinistramenti]MBS2533616.1 hypothetical protein [Catenulispora pinistramenti]